MPSPREQPTPPGKNRRRPDSLPSGWLWAILMIGMVLAMLYFLQSGGPAMLTYSEFMQLAKDGAPQDKVKGKNTNFLQATLIADRVEAELQKDARRGDLEKKIGSNTRVMALVPESEKNSGKVTERLADYAVPFGQQTDHSAWIPQLVM